MAVATVGLLVLSGVSADGTYLSGLLPGLLIMSFGMGSTFVPVTLIATTNVRAGVTRTSPSSRASRPHSPSG